MNKNEIVLEIVLAMIEKDQVGLGVGNNTTVNGKIVSDLYNTVYDSIKSE